MNSVQEVKSSRLRNIFIMFATLMLFWVMLEGSLAADVLIVGALVSLVIAILYPDGLSFLPILGQHPKRCSWGFAIMDIS